MWTRHILLTAASALAVVLAVPSTRAQSLVPVPVSGGAAALDPSTGGITGSAGSTPISCQFNAVTGQLSGTNCSQLLSAGGTLTNLERQIVNARVGVASAVSAEANVHLLDGLIDRRVAGDFIINAQVNGEMPTAGIGPQAFAGGSFLSDDRLGREKSGHNYMVTVGADHTAANLLIGGYIGYTTTDVDLKSLNGNLSSDGWVAGAYLTYLFDQTFSVTASGGYLDTSADLTRTFSGATVNANFGHTEWSGSFTGNAVVRPSDSVSVIFLAGLAYGTWKDDAYTDSRGLSFGEADGDNSWAKVGTLVNLSSGSLRPYVTATYARLLSSRAYGADPDTLSIGGGLAFGRGRFTGGVEVSTVLLQQDRSETSVGLNLRIAL